LTFCKRNNAKIIYLLIIFCVFIITLLFFLYQTVILQNKNIYGHKGEWGGGDHLRKFINIFVWNWFFLKLVIEIYSTGL